MEGRAGLKGVLLVGVGYRMDGTALKLSFADMKFDFDDNYTHCAMTSTVTTVVCFEKWDNRGIF